MIHNNSIVTRPWQWHYIIKTGFKVFTITASNSWLVADLLAAGAYNAAPGRLIENVHALFALSRPSYLHVRVHTLDSHISIVTRAQCTWISI